MPGQNHRERDHCDHHIQVEADVEEAESSFGAEAFRPLLSRKLAGRDVSDTVPTFFLGFIDLWPLVPYICRGCCSLRSRLVTFAATMS
jgi:hypothetical protein